MLDSSFRSCSISNVAEDCALVYLFLDALKKPATYREPQACKPKSGESFERLGLKVWQGESG